MSVHNLLNVKLVCESCGLVADRNIQFEYGKVRRIRYVLNQELEWDENPEVNVGERTDARLAIDGYIRSCPDCEHDGRYLVFLWHNRLRGVGPLEWIPELPDYGWVILPSESATGPVRREEGVHGRTSS